MDRDRQIKLMETAKARHQERVQHWLNDPEIRAALARRPAAERQPEPDDQHDQPRRHACG